MDSITYEVKPAKKLKNGDELTITARYDETLASRYHVNPIQTVRRVKVKDLPERFADVNEIPASFLSTLDDRTRSYLNKNMEQILNEDFTSFFIRSQPELVNQKQMYRVVRREELRRAVFRNILFTSGSVFRRQSIAFNQIT